MPDQYRDAAVLRLLDANANRAREALRVMEDYARFVLDSQELSLALKTLRHQMAEALAPVLTAAILHRDTPDDVGTTNKVPRELHRAGVGEVVTAAGKRLGEALRALEEFCKIADPAAAAKIEGIRYAAYDLELRLAFNCGKRPSMGANGCGGRKSSRRNAIGRGRCSSLMIAWISRWPAGRMGCTWGRAICRRLKCVN